MSTTPTWTYALLVGLLTTVTGCQSNSQAPTGDAERQTAAPNLHGALWILTELPGSPERVAVPPAEAAAALPDIRFDAKENRVTGSTGVNRFSGPYELSGESLRFGPLATTRRAGLPELMRLEDAYVQALTSTRGHRFDGQTLELLGADGQPVARFRAEATPTSRTPAATAPGG